MVSSTGYTLLSNTGDAPTDLDRASTRSLGDASDPSLPPRPPRHRLGTCQRPLYYTLGACALVVVLGSLFVWSEERLPTGFRSAVGASRDALESATRLRWGWMTQGELDDEFAQTVDAGRKGGSGRVGPHVTGAEEKGAGNTDTAEGTATGWNIECSSEAKALLGEPSFWIITASNPPSSSEGQEFAVGPRNPLPSNLPPACLAHAVFSARLVSSSGSLSATSDSETVYSLQRPTLSSTRDSYDISIPAAVGLPRQPYELQVTLEFGFYPGALAGECLNSDESVCDEVALSRQQGEGLRFIGEKIELSTEVKTIELTTHPTPASLPLCTDLSTLDGFWSSLAFHPISPSSCSLFDPSFPVPLLSEASTKSTSKTPTWIHFVGDSNSRNMFSHCVNSLGNGHKINAPKVVTSSTHNGTHASFASRWRSGEPALDSTDLPDLFVTWSWWYQTTPVSDDGRVLAGEEADLAWTRNVIANRDDLVRLVDTTFSDYLDYADLGAVLKSHPALATVASTIRPHRTYLSLGSHSERLSGPGLGASLDVLFDESTGLARAKRDRANLRVFTTTHVNAAYIPLDRFPHQDLVRNNAFISAKNALARSRPEFTESPRDQRQVDGGEGEASGTTSRVIDVEALTKGLTVGPEWMKPGKHGRGPDAVHFRDAVYDEWVRLVWTDLVQGGDRGVVERGLLTGVGEARMRKVKKSRTSIERVQVDDDWDDDEDS